ncbi:hypothetical protein JCM8097_001636 [Rhodosporidiobolus ruineniae]
MSTTSRSSSHLDRLPVELLEHIAAFVHADDQHPVLVGLNRAEPAAQHDLIGVFHQKHDHNIPEGCWPYWQGRGILALSEVSKKWRELTVGYIFESVTPHQLSRPFFRFVVEPSEVIREAIVEVAFLRSYTPTVLFATAAAFRSLPNLRRFRFPDRFSLPFLALGEKVPYDFSRNGGPDGLSHPEWATASNGAIEAYQTAVKRSVRELHITGVTFEQLEQLVEHWPPSAHLDSLYLAIQGSILGEACPGLRRWLATVRTLDMHDDERSHDISDSWFTLDASNLHSLTVTLNGSTSTLPWISRVAPRLQRLRLECESRDLNLSDTLALSFPQLRHLSLTTQLSPAVTYYFLAIFAASPLVSLDLHQEYADLSTKDGYYLAPTFFGTFFSADFVPPPSLRLLRFSCSSILPPPDLEPFRTFLAAHNVRLEFTHTALDGFFDLHRRTSIAWPAAQVQDGVYSGVPSTAMQGVRELLGWAGEQAEWAEKTGDEVAFGMLADALKRVKELQVLAKA